MWEDGHARRHVLDARTRALQASKNENSNGWELSEIWTKQDSEQMREMGEETEKRK